MLVRSNILLKSDHLLKFDIFFNLFFISNLKAAIYKNEFLINFIFFLLLTPSKSVIWLINRSDSFLVHGWFTGLGIVKLKTLTDCLSSSNLKTLISQFDIRTKFEQAKKLRCAISIAGVKWAHFAGKTLKDLFFFDFGLTIGRRVLIL